MHARQVDVTDAAIGALWTGNGKICLDKTLAARRDKAVVRGGEVVASSKSRTPYWKCGVLAEPACRVAYADG